MNLIITINGLKPIGVNHSHMLTTIGRHARRIKTTLTKRFETRFQMQLDHYQDKINEFNDEYDSKKHYLNVVYKFYIPVLVKSGKTINKRSGDIDGLIKLTQDCMFKALKADDAEIITVNATKIHSEAFKIEIVISTCPIRNIL